MDSWEVLRLGDRSCLVKYTFDDTSYEILVTDYERIYGERIDAKNLEIRSKVKNHFSRDAIPDDTRTGTESQTKRISVRLSRAHRAKIKRARNGFHNIYRSSSGKKKINQQIYLY